MVTYQKYMFDNKIAQPFRQVFRELYVKTDEENPTIGILLCTDKSDAIVEITLPEENNQIFASKYQTYLPSKDELKQLIEHNLK